ncbi:autotransporter outer membrane beta-barrel domain-containing protein [Sphingomonas panacisoli]|nr:autotransporter outer membrane beta-barrel domain-containing protein [Sphingomonas panacisoli]
MISLSTARRLLLTTALAPVPMFLFAGEAKADCLPNANGTNVTCVLNDPDGYKAGVDNPTTNGVTIDIINGATVGTPAATGPLLVVGTASAVNNQGTITVAAGQTAIYAGGGSTVNNAAISLGLTGNTIFGATATGQVNTFNNLKTVAGTGTVNGNVTSGGVTVFNNQGNFTGNLTTTGDTTVANTGVFTGNMVLGAGNDTITNTGTITGNIDMGAGTNFISFNSQASLPTGTLTAATSGTNTIQLTGTGAATLNIAVTNFDVLNKDGTGTWTLGQAITLDDRINVNAGTLATPDAGFLGGNKIVNNATVQFTNAASGTYSGVMSGTGVVNVGGGGAGVTTFSGANTYTGDTTITGGTLRVIGGAAIADTGKVVVTAPGIFDVGAAETVGEIGGNGSITLSGGTLTVGKGTFSGVISGTNGLTKNTTGTLVLSGANTFTGAATVTDGTLELQGGNAIGNTTAVVVNAAAGPPATSGRLLVTNAETIGSLSGNGGSVVLTANLTTGDAGNTSYAGVISGAGALLKQGTGTFTLTGANAYSGGTVVLAGTLEGNTTSLQGAILVNAGGTLLFTQPADGTYAGNLTGAGTVTKAGAGNLTLSGTNSGFSGTTNLNGGTVSIASAANIGTGTLAFNGGTLATTGATTLANAVTLGAGGGTINTGAATTLSGVISGTGALTKTGTANLTLSGANTYSGGTTVSAGTLTGTTTSLQGAIVNNAAVVFDQTGAGTYAGNLSGTGTLTKAGTGTVTLTGTNTYTGATTVSAGTLIAGGTGIGDTSAVTVATGATFQLAANETIGSLAGAGAVNLGAFTLTTGGNGTSTAVTGTLAGTAITKVGAGDFALNGTGTLTGGVAVNAGSVSIGGTYTSPATVASAATLNILAAGKLTGNVTAAAGSFTKVNGTLTGNVANAGTLSGTGTIVGAVTNTGTVAPGNSPGILNITGSYTQTAAGTLAIELTPSAVAGTGYDRVAVSGAPGTAALAGTLALTPSTGLYVAGTTYDIVTATGGVTGAFATVSGGTISPFLSFTPTGIVTIAGTNQVYRLTVTRTAYATGLGSSANANRTAVANGFQALVAGATGDAATLVVAVDNMTAAQAATFFDQASPEAYGGYVTGLQDQGQLFTRQIQLHLVNGRSGEGAKAGVWGGLYGQWGKGKDRGIYIGSDQDIVGGTLGVDFASGPLTFGVAGGYSENTVKFRAGTSNGKEKSWQAGGYVGYNPGNGVGADLQLAYINGDIDATRSIAVAGSTRIAAGSTSGNLFKAVGTVGYDFGKDGSKIRPFVGVDYSTGNLKAFSETGANAANLNVARIDADRTDLLVGVDVALKAGTITPYARAAYRYRTDDKNTAITASFNGVGGSAFTVTSAGAGQSQVDVDAGVSVAIGKGGAFSVGYQGSFRNDRDRHGVSAQLSFGF